MLYEALALWLCLLLFICLVDLSLVFLCWSSSPHFFIVSLLRSTFKLQQSPTNSSSPKSSTRISIPVHTGFLTFICLSPYLEDLFPALLAVHFSSQFSSSLDLETNSHTLISEVFHQFFFLVRISLFCYLMVYLYVLSYHLFIFSFKDGFMQPRLFLKFLCS